MVIALSIAIWAFAEARSLTTEARTATIVLAAPTGLDMTAWMATDRTQRTTATIRLEGSRAALARATQRLSEPVRLLIGDSLPTEVGPATVNLRDALRDHRVFDRLAVSVTDVSPTTIDVFVDEVISQQVPVRVSTGTVQLQGPPLIEPATVTVVGPTSILEGASFDSLTATTPRSTLDGLESGSTTQVPGLPLTIPAPWQTELIRVSPMSVDATITLRDTIDSHTIPSVPVMVRLSPTQMTRWQVVIAPENSYLRDVQVRGPGELVEAIRQGRRRVIATLQLEGAELAAGEQAFEAVLPDTSDGLTFVVSDSSVPVEVVEAGVAETGSTLDPGE